MMRQGRNLLISSVYALCFSLFAQSPAVQADENAAMERYALEPTFQHKANLHSRPGPFEDGAKGEQLSLGHGEPPMLWLPHGVVVTGATASLHNDACKASAIVIAKETGSSVNITHNKTLIYTKHRFLIQKVMKAPQGIEVGDQIQVIQVGGSLLDDGEKVRLNVVGLVPFTLGQSYLLILSHRPGAPADLYVPIRFSEVLRVVSNRIMIPQGERLISGADEAFTTGESIRDFSDSLKQATEIAPCVQ